MGRTARRRASITRYFLSFPLVSVPTLFMNCPSAISPIKFWNFAGLNLSHDQLFFLNYAQIWCGTMRPEDALSKIRSSVHSPGPIRVLGPLSNSPEFAKAYSCPLGSPMNPHKKCSVWWTDKFSFGNLSAHQFLLYLWFVQNKKLTTKNDFLK